MRRADALRRTAAAALVVLVAVSACSSDDDDQESDPGPTSTTEADPVVAAPAEPPFEVTTVTEVLVDTSRPTEARPERPLETTVRYPDEGDAPFPLVVFAHGLMDHPRDFAELTTAWARAGYVVAAPAFPFTNTDAPGGPDAGDFVNQPADVRFVIDEILRLSQQAGHALEGRIDGDRIGVAGHGLGVTTVLGPTYHSCCRDDRIDAAVALSGVVIDLDGAYEFSSIPLLTMFGDADEFLPPSTGADLYARARSPKLLVTISGGTHWPPYRDDADPADDAVVATTTRFWDHYLAGHGELDELLTAAAVEGVTTVEHDTE